MDVPRAVNRNETEDHNPAVIRLLNARAVRGYLHGLEQPSLLLQLEIAPPPAMALNLASLEALLVAEVPGYRHQQLVPCTSTEALADWLAMTAVTLQGCAGFPPLSSGRIVHATTNHQGALVTLALPTLEGAYDALARLIGWLIAAIRHTSTHAPLTSPQPELSTVMKLLRRFAPQGLNSAHFLLAAQQAGIPWRHLYRNIYQFGYGAHARWLDSSFSDQTAHIATRLAGNKQATSQILRQAGIPVAPHQLADNAELAVRIAQSMGFPVVVKPADKDGGVGVMAGLLDPPMVAKAYAAARVVSAQVLVEKHVPGRDYRVHVYRDEVYRLVERIPGGVSGDGHSSVTRLLSILNADPQRGATGDDTELKRIDLDDEAQGLLAEQGLTPESVAAPGRFVRLRRTANICRGGVPAECLERAHPDNLELAVRAARALRLDVAGIDLLIPDIGVSWLESGAAICEVNAQPQMGVPGPATLLSHLVEGQGRIPFVIVLGLADDADLARQLAAVLTQEDGQVGVATAEGLFIGEKKVNNGPCNAFAAGLALTADTQVGAVVLFVGDTHMLHTGLPVDRYDALVLAGAPTGDGDEQSWSDWRGFAQVLAAACTGPVIVDGGNQQWGPLLQQLDGRAMIANSRSDIVRMVAKAVAAVTAGVGE
jgi:cyanophycin synthetase